MPEYDTRFYQERKEGSARSARRIVPLVMSIIEPASVIDVGCGSGEWARAFKARGVQILGIDGYSDPVDADLHQEEFRRLPLEEMLPDVGRTFDLAVCLEVAEHLPPKRSDGFVRDLVRLAPAVLFSAAIPGQRGNHHINERWPDYWATLFARYGYSCFDFRMTLWEMEDVDWWYVQNVLLFIRSDKIATHSQLQTLRPERPRRLVHPVNYQRYLEESESQHAISAILRLLTCAIRRSLKHRLGY